MEQGREATVGRLPERRESARVVCGLQLGPSARVRGSEGKLGRLRKWACGRIERREEGRENVARAAGPRLEPLGWTAGSGSGPAREN